LEEPDNGIDLVILDQDLSRLSGDEIMKSYAPATTPKTTSPGQSKADSAQAAQLKPIV
jgi:hypothetical protein